MKTIAKEYRDVLRSAAVEAESHGHSCSPITLSTLKDLLDALDLSYAEIDRLNGIIRDWERQWKFRTGMSDAD